MYSQFPIIVSFLNTVYIKAKSPGKYIFITAILIIDGGNYYFSQGLDWLIQLAEQQMNSSVNLRP